MASDSPTPASEKVVYTGDGTKLLVFSGYRHPFNSFHRANFTVDGQQYHSLVHYMNVSKLYTACRLLSVMTHLSGLSRHA